MKYSSSAFCLSEKERINVEKTSEQNARLLAVCFLLESVSLRRVGTGMRQSVALAPAPSRPLRPFNIVLGDQGAVGKGGVGKWQHSLSLCTTDTNC